jgi:hypothetical protein
MYSNYKRYKLNYDDNIRALHLRSLKTPPSGAVMSDEDDADCAFSMRKGVKEFKLKTGTFHELRNRAIKLRRAKRCWSRKIRRIKRQMCALFPDK